MRDKQTKSSSIHELEKMLWEEVRLDILAEAEGTARPAGVMQKDYPTEYKLTHKLFCEMALGMGQLLVSNKQAETLSNMLKSENEGLSSIQEYLNKNPVNAFTLARLEKGQKFRPNRQKGSIAKKTKYIHKLAIDNPKEKALSLFLRADKTIIGKMREGTFANHVSKARQLKS